MSGPSDAQALRLGVGLARAQASVQQALGERLGLWHGLGWADFLLLDALAQAPQGHLPMRALAAGLHLAPSALLRQLLPLQKVGLLTRENGAVHLRPAGRSLQVEAAQTVGAGCAQICAAAGLDDATAGSLLAQLEAFTRGASRLGTAAGSQ